MSDDAQAEPAGPVARPGIARRSTSSGFGFEKQRRAIIKRSNSHEDQDAEKSSKTPRDSAQKKEKVASTSSSSDSDDQKLSQMKKPPSTELIAAGGKTKANRGDRMIVKKPVADVYPGKARLMVRSPSGSADDVSPPKSPRDATSPRASSGSVSEPTSARELSTIKEEQRRSSSASASGSSATISHSKPRSSKSSSASSSGVNGGEKSSQKKAKPKVPSLDLTEGAPKSKKSSGTGAKKSTRSGKQDALGDRSSKHASSKSPRRSKTPRAGDGSTQTDASAPAPSATAAVEGIEQPAKASEGEKKDVLLEVVRHYGESLAVHRERLAAAKMMLPTGLKHAATTRLVKTLRPRGSVDDDDNEDDDQKVRDENEESSGDENDATRETKPKKLRNVASPPVVRSSSRRRIKRTRSLPIPPSWEMRISIIDSSLKTGIAESLLISPSFEGGEARRGSNDSSSNVSSATEAGQTSSESETPLSARNSDADAFAMTAFEWLKTLDLKDVTKGSEETSSSDDENDDGDRDDENEQEQNQIREETWKLIDEMDNSSEEENDDVIITPRVEGHDADAEVSTSGTDGEMEVRTPRTIEMEDTVARERPKSSIVANHPTLRSMKGFRQLSVIGMEGPNSARSSNSDSASPSIPKSGRPISLALSGVVPNDSPGSPMSSARGSRPRLVKMDRVTDLRGSGGAPRLPIGSRSPGNTVKVLRPSPKSSPRAKEAEEDVGTIVEEDGVTFLIKNVRKSRAQTDTESPRSAQAKRMQKLVQAGSFENLISLLIVKPMREQKFRNEFLSTLPWFSSPVALLDELVKLYAESDAPDLPSIQARIVDFIHDWIDSNFRYFLIDPSNLKALRTFLDDHLITSAHFKHRDMLRRIVNYKAAGINPQDLLSVAVQMKSTKSGLASAKTFQGSEAISWLRKSRQGISDSAASEILTQLVRDGLIVARDDTSSDGSVTVRFIADSFSKSSKYAFAVSKEDEQRKTVEHLLPVFLSKPASSSGSRFGGFHPDVFAKQLAIFEQNLYLKVEPHELHFWIKGDKEKRASVAPNLCHVIQFINKMSNWVATEIVLAANPKQRVGMIKKFILVAQWCLKFKNYQGLLEVMGGLGNTAVSRLSAWRELSEKYTDMHRKLAEVVSPQQNWKSYRPLIEREDPPCIPYVGLFLSDLTFLSDGMPTKLDDGRINWKKMSRISTVLGKVVRLQQVKYDYPPHHDVLKFLAEEIYAMDDKDLFARSRAVEPGASGRSRSNSIV